MPKTAPKVPDSKGLFRREVYEESVKLVEQFAPKGGYGIKPKPVEKQQPSKREAAQLLDQSIG